MVPEIRPDISTTARSLKGWTLRDRSRHVYTFGTYKLGAGKTVKIHTGSGTNTAANRYQGRKAYVWNNTGDQATPEEQLGHDHRHLLVGQQRQLEVLLTAWTQPHQNVQAFLPRICSA